MQAHLGFLLGAASDHCLHRLSARVFTPLLGWLSTPPLYTEFASPDSLKASQLTGSVSNTCTKFNIACLFSFQCCSLTHTNAFKRPAILSYGAYEYTFLLNVTKMCCATLIQRGMGVHYSLQGPSVMLKRLQRAENTLTYTCCLLSSSHRSFDMLCCSPLRGIANNK